jgi:hypothetical protein
MRIKALIHTFQIKKGTLVPTKVPFLIDYTTLLFTNHEMENLMLHRSMQIQQIHAIG